MDLPRIRAASPAARLPGARRIHWGVTLKVLVQLPPDTDWTKKPSATVEMVITKNNQEVKRTSEQSSQLANAAAQMTVIKSIPVDDFQPGQYSVMVRVTDNLTKDVTAAQDKFTVR